MPDGCMPRHAYEPKHIGIFFLNCHTHYTESREKKYGKKAHRMLEDTSKDPWILKILNYTRCSMNTGPEYVQQCIYL